MTPAKRAFSQAISEGDGISFIVEVDGAEAAREAERDGAKAIVLYSNVESVLESISSAVSLPILFYARGAVAAPSGVDACVVYGDRDRLERAHRELAHDLELVVRVEDEDELEDVLEHFDPEILVLARSSDDERLPHVLDLLSDVPAGKLAIAELEHVNDDEISELERAGCDAVLLGAPPPAAG